jgi:proline racemase
MPTRVITSGIGVVPGTSMQERRLYFEEHLDHLRLMLMREPRGHSAMSGAFLQPATRADADWGVLFVEVSGLLPMCGHGTIGVATVLVETGMVAVTEPETVIRLDTPAGLVEATVTVTDGHAERVRLRNVPAFVVELDAEVEIPSLGNVRYDMAFGGNFYALVAAESVGLDPVPESSQRLIEAGLDTIDAINAAARPAHPLDPAISGCKHVVFHKPGHNGAHARNATSIHPGWLDRSPCGTGTSARMAALHRRGELALGEEFVNESVIGSRFTGRLLDETTVGDLPAVIPEVSGRAWVTGMGQYLLDPTDPFPSGFDL